MMIPRANGLLTAIAVAMMVQFALGNGALAAVTWTGNIDPADPTTWTTNTYGYVGRTSDGSIIVDSGSELVSYYSNLGYNAGATGQVTVTGTSSKWDNSSDLHIGGKGNGTLSIEEGGMVENSTSYIGYDAGSTGNVKVTGSGSQWINRLSLGVGRTGIGTLSIEDGGVVSNDAALLGNDASATGIVTVTGAGSRWNNTSDLTLGRYGSGTLTIEEGGEVRNRAGALGLLSGSTGVATVTGSGSQWNNSANLSIGGYGNGSLLIEAGGLVSNTYSYLGGASDSTGAAISTGVVTVTGSGSQWLNSDRLYVSSSGAGTLNVLDGAVVSASVLFASLDDLHGDGSITATTGAVLDADLQFDAASGTQDALSFGSGGALTVTAAGGDLGAGYKGMGTLTIADGVTVNANQGFLGRYPGSMGTAMVKGDGSQWNNRGSLVVGDHGSGTLEIEDGGIVGNTFGTLAFEPGSSGTAMVTGSGSQWNNSTELFVGLRGVGTLLVEAGGRVSNSTGSLGNFRGSTGVAKVHGSGSQWDSGSLLYVGRSGNGKLTIEAGGTVNATVGYLGYVASGAMTVAGSGSQFNSSSLYVGYGSTGGFVLGNAIPDGPTKTLSESDDSAVLGSIDGMEPEGITHSNPTSLSALGILTVTNGGEVISADGYVGYRWTALGKAEVDGAGSTWTNQLNLTVGGSGVGTLSISSGGLVSVGGTLTIDEDSDAESFLNMATGGMLALSSEVDSSITDFLNYVQGTGAIRYWDATTSDWAHISQATLGVDYTLEYLATGDLAGYTLLTVGTPVELPGDYNDDGLVDAADYTVWRDALGGAVLTNDSTPGTVDQRDYQVWRDNYGGATPLEEVLAENAAPEPGALLLLLSGAMAAFTRRASRSLR